MTPINNVQSFEKLLGICTGFGGAPGQQNLRVENLSDLLKLANVQYPVSSNKYINH